MVKPDMENIRRLSVSERLALVEEIWDSISSDPEGVPVSEAQLAEARRRLSSHRDDPEASLRWEDVEKRLRDEL